MIQCTLYYNEKTQTPHLRQIFTGFFELQKRKFIKVKLEYKDWLRESYTQNLLMVVVDGKERVIYDVNDGFYWIYGNREENLEYFQKVILPNADYYFKRSFNRELLDYRGINSTTIFPLGLNYLLSSKENKMDNTHLNFMSWTKYKLKSIEMVSKLLKIDISEKAIQYQNFEYYPLIQNKSAKILFLTRLWSPDIIDTKKVTDPKLIEEGKEGLNTINTVRTESIKQCRKQFGNNFIGGLTADSFSNMNYPDLIAPKELTQKANYLKIIKQCDICVATTGLHNSIGWKFGEYVAAARGIVSEKLEYEIPGKFSAPVNYLEFEKVENLINNISSLVDNRDVLSQMMQDNYEYYNSFVRPDNLVLNTLVKIKMGGDKKS